MIVKFQFNYDEFTKNKDETTGELRIAQIDKYLRMRSIIPELPKPENAALELHDWFDFYGDLEKVMAICEKPILVERILG